MRNFLYDHSILKIHRVETRVVSIGNITTGGTGKTPIVHLIAREAFRRGFQPGVVARGYMGRDQGAGIMNDEGVMLKNMLPDLALAQDPDRVAAANIAISRMGADFLIMDDGFQHRRLARDLDIVMIDASLPFGYGRVLPAGLLREPIKGLSRADVLVLSRCDQVNGDQLAVLQADLNRAAPGVRAFLTEHTPLLLRSMDGSIRKEPADLSGRKVCLVCGIGRPAAFLNTVFSLGAVIVNKILFPDHYGYGKNDVETIKRNALESGAEYVVTTAKDGVKLSGLSGTEKILVLEVGVKFLKDESTFYDLVFEGVGPTRSNPDPCRNGQ